MESLTPESTWKELCIAISKRLMTVSHALPKELIKQDLPDLEEYINEGITLTTHVWTKSDLDLVLNEGSSDQEDEAADYLDEHGINPTDLDRNQVFKKATELGWEAYPDPTPQYLYDETGGEPPLSADERTAKSREEKMYAKG